MILQSHGVNVRALVPEFGTSIVPPPGSNFSYGAYSWAGRLVSDRDAVGLVAVAACIRLLSSQIAAMPMQVGSGGGSSWTPEPDSWQQKLFDDPQMDGDPFTFTEDIISSIESTENAFVQKTKPQRLRSGQPGVVELRPLDPDYVSVRIVDGQKRVLWWDGAKSVDATKQILHIRGWSPCPSPVGKSRIRLHANALGTHVALGEYQGRYFQNDARPSIVITKGPPTVEGRRDMRAGFNNEHQGSSRAHGLGILWGDADIKTLSPALRDTQAPELMEAALREACRMFGIHPKYLGALERETPESPESKFTSLFRMSLFPRCRRVESAFKTDPDLFRGGDSGVRYDPTELMRADTATTAAVIKDLVQVGVLTANEGRAMLSMPAHSKPAANDLLDTPVGGGANLNAPTPASPTPAATPQGDRNPEDERPTPADVLESPAALAALAPGGEK